jgi:hypothetical protein
MVWASASEAGQNGLCRIPTTCSTGMPTAAVRNSSTASPRRLSAMHARGEMPLRPATAEYEAEMRDYGLRAVRSSLTTLRQGLVSNPLALAGTRAWFELTAALPAPQSARLSGHLGQRRTPPPMGRRAGQLRITCDPPGAGADVEPVTAARGWVPRFLIVLSGARPKLHLC